MQEIHYLFKGLIIGLSIAVPVGPIGVLCIRHTLTKGRMVGFLSGLGAATADGLYGAIAGFGLTFLVNFIIGKQMRIVQMIWAIIANPKEGTLQEF